MKSTMLRLGVMLFCVLMLTSCSIRTSIVIFNNLGGAVEIRLKEGAVAVEKGYNVEFNGTIENGHSVTFIYPIDQSISIQTGTTNWTYRITEFPPLEYQVQSKFRTQLEATGEIYVLLPTEDFPLTNFTNQPSGFPLKPITQP